MKKFLAIILSALLVITLASCGISEAEQVVRDAINSADKITQDSVEEAIKQVQDELAIDEGKIEAFEEAMDGIVAGLENKGEELSDKDSYMEISDAGTGEVLAKITDADKLKQLFEKLNRADSSPFGALPEGLVPKLVFRLYQEKTLLAGEAEGTPRDYMEVLNFVLYDDSNYVTLTVIPGTYWEDVPFGMDNFLTYSYKLPEAAAESLRDPSNFE